MPSVSLLRKYTSRLYALISSPYISDTFNPSSSKDIYLLSLPNLNVPSKLSSKVFWPNLKPTIPESTLPCMFSSGELNPRSTPRPTPVSSPSSLCPRKALTPTIFSPSISTVLPLQSCTQFGRIGNISLFVNSSIVISKSLILAPANANLVPSNDKNDLPEASANWKVPSSRLKKLLVFRPWRLPDLILSATNTLVANWLVVIVLETILLPIRVPVVIIPPSIVVTSGSSPLNAWLIESIKDGLKFLSNSWPNLENVTYPFKSIYSDEIVIWLPFISNNVTLPSASAVLILIPLTLKSNEALKPCLRFSEVMPNLLAVCSIIVCSITSDTFWGSVSGSTIPFLTTFTIAFGEIYSADIAPIASNKVPSSPSSLT